MEKYQSKRIFKRNWEERNFEIFEEKERGETITSGILIEG